MPSPTMPPPPPGAEEMGEAFRRATRNARALFGALDSSIVICSDEGDWRSRDTGSLALKDPAARLVIQSGKPIWIEDAEADPDYRDAARTLGCRFYAAAAIRSKTHDTNGVICVVGREPRPRDDRLLSLLQDLADSVAEGFDRVSAMANEREQAAVLNSLVKTLPLGIVMTDCDLRILKCSPGWAAYFGRREEDVTGGSLYDVTEYFSQFKELHQDVLAGNPHTNPRLKHPGGYLSTQLMPWRRADGEIGGMIVTTYDVTDLVETMKRFERSERRLQIAVNLADLHAWEVDFKRRTIEKVGEDTFFEKPIEFEDVENDFFFAVHPDDRHLALESIEKRKAGNIDDRLICRANRKDGKEVWMSSAAELHMGPDGKPARMVGVFQNVTKMKEAEKALIQAKDEADAANRAKSEFLANMSHEIRTPLNGVLGMAQVIEADELSPVQRDRIRVVRESGAALLAILNDVLDLSKIQAGKLELNAAPFDIHDLVRVVTAAFDGAASAKDVVLEAHVDASAQGGWMGDALRLRQVLSNLIGNAIKFTPAGRITVDAWRVGGELRVAVRDSGIGIPQDRIAALFEKFTQADASTTRKFGGTGLGLSICRELVILMGGHIEVESEEGVGSCFTVHLPLERAELAPAPARAEPAAAATPDRPLRILAAEDNATNQLVLRSLLAPLDVDLTIVGDGQAAVDAYRAGGFDIVLMDVQMPRMNGVDATVAIRALETREGRARTPILALSANVMSHQIDEYLAVGMDGSIAKPIEVDKLYAALAEALTPAEDEAVRAAS